MGGDDAAQPTMRTPTHESETADRKARVAWLPAHPSERDAAPCRLARADPETSPK